MSRVEGEKVTLEISKELYERAKKWVESTSDFSSVEELIEFLLGEVLSEESGEQVYSPEEEEEIKERLRSLGYL